MKNFIIWLLIAFTFIGSIVYFVFSSDNSFTVTYIKFNINPEFIIGVNDHDEVRIYNPLNEDAKILNLSMFNGYKLEKAMEIILNKLNNYLDGSSLNITVITKDTEKINYYYNKINSVIKEQKYGICLLNKQASYEELLAYSNEVAYDLKPSFNSDTLLLATNELNESVTQYIDQKLTDLSLDNLSLEEKKVIIDNSLSNGYFDNYSLINYKFNNYAFIINEKSNYRVNFIYDNDEINYNVELNLVLEYKTNLKKKDILYQVIEEYRIMFTQNEIKNLENKFYKFN